MENVILCVLKALSLLLILRKNSKTVFRQLDFRKGNNHKSQH